jgi:hypothetical protein
MSNTPHKFSYIFDVRDNRQGPFSGRISEGFGECLLGTAPELAWTEYTPPGGQWYARVELNATGKSAQAVSVSFVIDRGLMTVLRPGDQLHIAAFPALGLSIVHDDFLVAAAGPADVLAHLSLGSEVEVRYPGEDLEKRYLKMRRGFTRYLGNPVPGPKSLVEFAVAGETEIMRWGRPKRGAFELLVRGSSRPEVGLVSIERLKICPETSAHTSAQLMDRDGFQIVVR